MDGFEDLPGPVFTAKFNSDCANCEFKLMEGQAARFEGNDAVHLKCPVPRPACTTCWLVHGIAQEECE
jgi:hypothetical protein